MLFDPILVPTWLTVIAALVMTAGIAFAAVAAPWRALLSAPERQHVSCMKFKSQPVSRC